MKHTVVSLGFLFLVWPLYAELEWELMARKTTVHPIQLTTTLIFPFENTGKSPVKITKITTSCGCITTPLPKKIYQPGEKGKLPVTFLLRGRSGLQKKHITVTISDAPKTPTRLEIEINIPSGIKLSTQRLVWKTASTHPPQSCRLINHSPNPIYLEEASPTIRSVKAELKTIRAGYEYELIVKPEDGLSNLRAFVKVTTTPPPGLTESKYYKVYLFIK